MRKVYIILFWLGILFQLESQVAPKLKIRQIHLEYISSNKTIEVQDTSFIITDKKDVFENPASSIPTRSISEDRSYSLSRKEVYDLIKFIQDCKFFELNNAYGAPEAERSYPTKIRVKMLGKEKEVVYRSNPTFPPSPEAFSNLEKYLFNLRK